MDSSHPGLPPKQRPFPANSPNVPGLLPLKRTPSPVNISGPSLPPKRTPSPVNNSGPSLPPKRTPSPVNISGPSLPPKQTPSPVNNSGPSLPPKQRTPSPVDNNSSSYPALTPISNSDPSPLQRGGDSSVHRSSRRLRQICMECEHMREVDDTGLCRPCRLKLKIK